MKSKLIPTLVLLLTAGVAQGPPPSAVDSLVAAERAFAKKSHDSNSRDAFLANITDQAVIFTPGPVNAKDVFSKQAPPPSPPPTTLDWAPAYAEVAQSGNMGFTTGPYTVTDNKTKAVTSHGTFFSIWEKQVSGEWKVALDFGVPTVKARDVHNVKLKTGTPSTYHPAKSGSLSAEMADLTHAEGLLSAGTPDMRSKAYDDALTSDAFVVLDGLTQISDAASRAKHLADMKKITKWTLNGGSLSSTHDLAYFFGSYEVHLGNDPKAPAKMGYFARVWKRDAQGKWKIALDDTQAPQ